MQYELRAVRTDSLSVRQAVENVEGAAITEGFTTEPTSRLGIIVGAGDAETAERFVDDPNLNPERETVYMAAIGPVGDHFPARVRS